MSILADSLVDRVAGIIPRYSMFSAGDQVGVAVSGGADSVVLLHILSRLSESFQVKLTVLHVNHLLRGTESDTDEEFVRALAESLTLDILVERATVGSGNLEQEARQARRKFFKRAMEQHGWKRVALGHTRSDQAETVVFRFLRGSGLPGLAGMRMVTDDGLIRPLLTTSRDEVRDWAVVQGIAWREDSSNANLDFARNRLRHSTLPALTREFNPNLEQVLTRTAELAQSEEDYWVPETERLYGEIAERTHLGLILRLPPLTALHMAVQRRVLRKAIKELRGDLRSIDLQHVDAILSLCSSSQGHARAIIPGVDALRSFEQLLLTRPGELNSYGRHYHLELRLGEICELPFRAGRICVNWAKPESDFCANFKEAQEFTAEVVNVGAEDLGGQKSPATLYVRNWEPGDALQRLGHQGAEKIKSLFQEHRIVLWERRHWPVVVCGEEIVWTRRFGAAAKFGVAGKIDRGVRLIYWKAD